MAAGLSLEEDKFELFQQRFGELVTEWLDPSLLQGEVVSDGPLSPAEMTMEVAQLLRDAGPWGQMFPEPLFDGHFLSAATAAGGRTSFEGDGCNGWRRSTAQWYCF